MTRHRQDCSLPSTPQQNKEKQSTCGIGGCATVCGGASTPCGGGGKQSTCALVADQWHCQPVPCRIAMPLSVCGGLLSPSPQKRENNQWYPFAIQRHCLQCHIFQIIKTINLRHRCQCEVVVFFGCRQMSVCVCVCVRGRKNHGLWWCLCCGGFLMPHQKKKRNIQPALLVAVAVLLWCCGGW